MINSINRPFSDFNSSSEDGEDPLYEALFANDFEALKLMLSTSRPLEYEDKADLTLIGKYFDVPEASRCPKILKLFIDEGLFHRISRFQIYRALRYMSYHCTPAENKILCESIKTLLDFYHEGERIELSSAIFESKHLILIEYCLKESALLVFDEDANPWSVLVEAGRMDLATSLAALQISSAEEALNETLVGMVVKGEIEIADALLALGAKLEAIGCRALIDLYEKNYPVYRWAIEQLGRKIVKVLDYDKDTFLHTLMYSPMQKHNRQQWLQDIEEIVKLGVSPLQTGGVIGLTPLEVAGKRGRGALDVCKLFVRLMGMDPKNTALHIAILEEDEEKIKDNIHYIGCENSCLQTPFEMVAELGKTHLIPLFLEHLNFTKEGDVTPSLSIDKSSLHPLAIALENHQFEMAQMLWDLGCKESVEVVQVLISRDQEIKIPFFNIFRNPPKIFSLVKACETNDLAAVETIVIAYPHLLKAVYDSKTLLAVAVDMQSVEMVSFLLAKGDGNIYGTSATFDDMPKELAPLYRALCARNSDICELLLDYLPAMPTFKQMLEDNSPKDLRQNWRKFCHILYLLIKSMNLESILLLAKHRKSSEFVLREGIVQLLEAGWDHIPTINTLIEEGFDINGVKKGESDRIASTPLSCAISANNLPLTKFLVAKGAVLETRLPTPLALVPPPLVTAAFSNKTDVEMFLFLIDLYQARKMPIAWNFVIEKSARFRGDHRLFLSFLNSQCALKAEENKIIAAKLSDLVFDPILNLEAIPFCLLSYGVRYLKSAAEWLACFEEVERFASRLNKEFNVPPYKPQERLWFEMTNETITAKFINQIYYHIFCGMNAQLAAEPRAIERIAKLIVNSDASVHDSVMLALQGGSTIQAVEEAIPYVGKSGNSLPPASFFKIQGEIMSKETPLAKGGVDPFQYVSQGDLFAVQAYLEKHPCIAVQKEIEGWLNYFAVFRARAGLKFCAIVLKHQKTSCSLLLKALVALERISIKRWNKQAENAQIKDIMDIMALHPSIKIQACKTLWALSQDGKNELLKDFFTKELASLGDQLSEHKDYAVELIRLLGNFDDLSCSVQLNHLMDCCDIDVAYEAVKTMSKIGNQEQLLKCLKVIDGPVWQRHKKDESTDNIHVAGSFLMFRARPETLHDNPHAMKMRILDRLVQLEPSSIQTKIDEICHKFKMDMASNPELLEFEERFHKIPRSCTRYVGMPLYFPKDAAIGRGLSCRKGPELFYESIRDLIRKGCGSTDLTLETAEVEGQTWGRLGHIFGSHNSQLFFDHEGIYFNGALSAFIVASASFYNAEYMRGNARMESEGTFNNVWYNGIPKQQLQAIFLEKQNHNDIDLLAGTKPITVIKDALSSPIFKDQSLRDLVQLRRHLQAKDLMSFGDREVEISLADRIHYYDHTKKPPLPLAEVESIGLKFVTEEELLHESLRRAAGRQLISKKFQCTS